MKTTNNDAAGGQQLRLQIVPFAELPPDEQELLAAYRRMDDHEKGLTLRLAESGARRHPRPAPLMRLVVGGTSQ